MSRFLAIDPGSVNIGLAIFDRKELLFSFSFVIEGRTLQEKLYYLYEVIEEVIGLYKPNTLIYEEQIFLKNAAFLSAGVEVIKIVGALCLIACLNKFNVVSFKPKEIKTVVTGKGSASKKMVEASVQLFANKKSFSSNHEVDAIAIGMCYLKRLKEDDRTENE